MPRQRRMRLAAAGFWILALVSLARGSAGLVRPVAVTGRSGAASPPAVAESIALARVDAGRWRATYRLAEPVERLVFQRAANFYRERVWTVVTPGYELARDGDLQVLRSTGSPAPATEVVVEFPEFTENLTAEYELFVTFSDGGRAIYTGHLYASPDDRPMIRTLELATAEGERLILRGGVHDGSTTWTDEAGDGTYAFFGSTEPIETDDVIAVIDEGLPDWARDEFSRWLPRLFATYRDRFDAALPWKPLVLYGFEPSDQPGFSYGGGTLTGLIQLTVSGDAWREPGQEARERALGFLAHEVVHLWNGQLTRNDDDSWIHEGSAEAIADRMLVEFGVFGPDALREREEGALNRCLLALGGDPIKALRDSRVPYDCGRAMAFWTEAAIRDAGRDADLLDFWRSLIHEALDNDGVYDADRYLAVAAELGVGSDVTRRMRVALTREGGGDPVGAMTTGLAEAGVPLVTGGTPAPDYRRELVRRAFAHLMGTACGGRYSFNGGDPLHTYPIEGCAPFESSIDIDAIDGFDVGADGHWIFDRVVEACSSGETVELAGPPPGPGAAETRVEVACDRPLAPRPAWVALGEGP